MTHSYRVHQRIANMVFRTLIRGSNPIDLIFLSLVVHILGVRREEEIQIKAAEHEITSIEDPWAKIWIQQTIHG